MILLLLLILPLLEDEKRPSKHVGKLEWMTSIADSTSKPARNARPPPATDVSRKLSLSGSSKHIFGGLGVHLFAIIVYSKTTPPTRSVHGL